MSHCNAHGIRKGSGSYASSATTQPPSFVATAARGEWSIGKVLGVYFKFGTGGDQYLGRLLAFLDPNDSSFAVLPPHWKDPTHPAVERGLQICFRKVLDAHRNESHDPTGLLRLLLASIVHHSTWITSVCSARPDHPFHGLALFDNHELLGELKSEHLTLEPTQQVPLATGVPAHIDHAVALKKVFDLCTQIDLKLDRHSETLRESICDAIDQKVEAEGGVNSVILAKSLDQLKDELFRRIDTLGQRSRTPPSYEAPTLPVVESDVQRAGPFSFHYKGTSWCIPESFAFPQNMTRLAGWRKWLRVRCMLRAVKDER